ncbi:MAG TPA: hypothetical protein VHW23_39310 [Kofleriaceae bacterium]|nr:hypothetical protein [Kofleriaceae bacterium]
MFCLSLLIAPEEPALTSWATHPGWLLVLLLSARYGSGGLLAGGICAAAGVTLASLCAGTGLGPLAARALALGDLGTLVASALVARVADSQQRRGAALASQMTALEERALGAEDSVVQLTETAVALRVRADRTETSLSFLYDIAVRMASSAPRDTAEAALELALARTGARVGVVEIADGGRLRTLATRGSLDALALQRLQRDRTVSAAHDLRRAIQACDVDGVRICDSDLAAPILSHDGRALGVIALRGVPFAALGAAALSDLSIVASWLARGLATATMDCADSGGSAPELRRADAG